MDNRSIHELFSRSSTPPNQQPQLTQQSQHQQSQHQQFQHLSNNSSPNLIDSLFNHISSPPDHQGQQSATLDTPSSDNLSVSAPITPVMPLTDEPLNPSTSTNATNADRQSALLSLLSGPGPRSAPVQNSQQSQQLQPTQQTQQPQQSQQPQQVPTPPGSSQRSNASPPHTENQKILLEQLMSGGPPRSSYPEAQRGPQTTAAPSPPYNNQREPGHRPYDQHDQPTDMSPRSQANPPPHPAQQQQVQPPSPRRSMFEFTSPFDHLSSTTSSVKKKPVPPQSASVSSGNEDSSSWTTVTDPKRQSVENLLENLTRGQPSHFPAAAVQPQAPAYEAYLSGGDFSIGEHVQSRPPLPPIPTKPVPNRTASPRASPPKNQPQRSQVRLTDPSVLQQGPPQAAVQLPTGLNRREKESSPGPRGGAKPKASATQTKFSKPQSSPSPQVQTILFDVSQQLDEIQAPRDSVKSTAIALVKQDSVFLPGTTIGATHWVAYAMTRGRVRVISRSSGDRTLLQLPQVFSPSSSITDMAVYGNRLAGVTSDGGFVVWELPEVITDDVPGLLLLCVPPTSDVDALRAVKWHPKEPDTLAVASDNKIYVIDLANTLALHNQPLPHADLHHIGQLFTVSSPVVAFDFDVMHYALATISEDSTLTIWNMHDRLPYTTHKIRGEDIPSSMTFVDGGLVIGRKNGTILQLLSISTKTVLSTVKFINGQQEDNDMFGHVIYDSRIQTLWVANSRRDSMIAFKINFEPSFTSGEEAVRGYFEQVIEFAGPKPTIHFVILTADADPNGDEAHAACVAAKVPSGDLALVAFSVHSTGVDQILIRKEWFDNALMSTSAKFPHFQLPQSSPPIQDPKPQRVIPQVSSNAPPPPAPIPAFVPRSRTPPSEDVENDPNRDDSRFSESKAKGAKGKNVNWKEGGENLKDKEKGVKISDATLIGESSLGQALTREIRKTEENLHTRIGRLIGKEMDKQHQRLEDARAHEQAEDFARQEKILKLISTELTRNTTRVVELAVKSEVQNSVLPSLENITKNEVKAALNDQIGRGLIDFVGQSLPHEMEKLLIRPDISNHFAHVLSTNLTPMIERHVKEAVTKTFIPVYTQQSSTMHQEILRELRNEIHSVKTELTAWQNEAFRSHETSIRELEHTVRTLSDQVKFLSMNPPAPHHHLQQTQPSQSSPGATVPQLQGSINQSHVRQQNLPPVPPAPASYTHPSHANFQQPTQPMHAPWYGTSIAAPQASHPATIPQPPPPTQTQAERTPPIKPEQWDEIYLGVLHTQDASKLRDLLSHTNPEVIMPLNGVSLVSQAVILTLVHRLSAVVGETPPNDETFKTSLWWLQRSVSLLRPEDKLITDFIPRVIPNVQHLLNTTKQRLTILPGGPSTLETARTLSDIQETLRRKVSPV